MASTGAQAAKEKGNAAFKSGDYPAAIGHYTSAIIADNKDPTFPLNRAAAYLKLGKNEDAERDCSTVLGLSPKNAKAYFRRGQARLALEKYAEAQADFQHALRLEPSNDSVKAELKKAQELMQKAYAKAKERSKATPAVIPSPPPLDPSPPSKPRRRRVPITIVEGDDADSSKSISSLNRLTSTQSNVTASPGDDLMKPVSSRTLAQGPPMSGRSSNMDNAASSPGISSASASSSPPAKPSTFREAKQARDSSKPSRAAGGGIFRGSGEHVIFGNKEQSNGASSPAPTPSITSPTLRTATLDESLTKRPSVASPSMTSDRPHLTLFTFTRKWESAKSDDDRWSLLSQIPPSSLPALFQTSLEPSLLASMLATFLHVLRSPDINQQVKEDVKQYMSSLSRVPRFNFVLMLLSRNEKDTARQVWSEVGGGTWDGL